MKYVLGIDGGGTKTVLQIGSLDGTLLSERIGGPSNIQTTSLVEVSEGIQILITSALADLGLSIADCAACCIGAAGADRPKDRDAFYHILRSIGLQCPILATNDAEIMLAAVAEHSAGIALISGTGSIAYGRDKAGRVFRSGGWGHVIGDEGSAYWIAAKAITAALRYFDNRGKQTTLLKLLMEKIGIEEAQDFIKFIYSEGSKSKIASLAIVVDEANKAGDQTAREILQEAAEELCLMCEAVASALAFDGEAFAIICGGSVMEHNNYLFQAFRNQITQKYPKAEIRQNPSSNANGAVRMALGLLEGKAE